MARLRNQGHVLLRGAKCQRECRTRYIYEYIYIFFQRDGIIILWCCLNRRLALSDFEAVMPDEWKNRANRLGLTRQPLLPLRSPEIPVCRSPAPRNCAARQRTRAFWGHSTSSSQVFTIGDDFKYIATSVSALQIPHWPRSVFAPPLSFPNPAEPSAWTYPGSSRPSAGIVGADPACLPLISSRNL
nr:hypothetical protein B24P7.170 [imported] - Neurospora crassa [Neurospora crassa]